MSDIQTPREKVYPTHSIKKNVEGNNNLSHRQVKHTCVYDIEKTITVLPKQFTLKQVYDFIPVLQKKHPENKNIHAKIRQSLQIMRSKGIIDFLGQGNYKKRGV
jgi:hypothetical protein